MLYSLWTGPIILTVQLLKANGCRVLGLDFNEERLKIAATFGAETFSLKSGETPTKLHSDFLEGAVSTGF